MPETPNMGFYRGESPPPMVVGPDGKPSGSAEPDKPQIDPGPDFGPAFDHCMRQLKLPVPASWYTDSVLAVTALRLLAETAKKFGTKTVGELVAAGELAPELAVAGDALVTVYAGACAGCLVSAGIDVSDALAPMQARHPEASSTE